MVRTRSGNVYAGESYPLAKDYMLDPRNIENVVRGMMADLSQIPNQTTGNIAGLAAVLNFLGDNILYQLHSHSNSSRYSFEQGYAHHVAPITSNIPGEVSNQRNIQMRNHTEPKLLQEFKDRFCFEGNSNAIRWVALVTQIPVCPSCRRESVYPFSQYALASGFDFKVYTTRNEPIRRNARLFTEPFGEF
ncbi:hypothetical protein J2D73_18710 [Acetobacter sacchari]|uniref:Uncharacterized protein n=1 Tax=Acetobacter sacchari TaxID=2661687 RepID=A0ABS3M103_9PROT|nr:hypothetical protein [Acetobacter sacchari]MBO1361818.1 hypothetical protein [Acetobacter sacchari]